MMDWVLFVHIVVGIVWVGGVMWQEAHISGARRHGEEAYVRSILSSQATNGRVFPATTILVIGTAVWMVLGRAELSFGTLWIDLSTGLFVLSFLTGILYFARGEKRLNLQLASEGYSPALGAEVRRVHMVGRVEVIVLLILVWLMVFKPGA